MALRVVEHAGLTDVGRQREANEDSYVVADPVFAVADGMGGAQAGEVASRIAAEIFGAAAAADGTPEEQLIRMVQEANRRIWELAQEDSSRRGMGTTCTVAMVGPQEVTIAHVGDSRAYRLRDSQLSQLTHDHSLVAELERSGQLSREAAEQHPQRSIITRALGPERDVEVDAHTHSARSGDLFVLCTDGLTGMITDDEIASIVRAEPGLSAAAAALIRAANQSGGRDNITGVLFRVEDDGEAPADHDTLSGEDTIHQGLTSDDVHAAVREQERTGARTATASGMAVTGAARPSPQPRRASGGRRLTRVLAGVLVLGLVAGGLYLAGRQVHFIGTDDRGLVTLYRGLPYDLPLGIELYSAEHTSGVPIQTITAPRRERLLDHEWRSRGDAEDLVRQLERGTLDRGGAGSR